MVELNWFEISPPPTLPGDFSRARHHRRRWGLPMATGLLAAAIAAIPFQTALALIHGGKGNKPVPDPGWPRGAAAIFNNPGRIAWWEGPPFGGGQWHAECRGDARALSAVLAEFAKLDAQNKRIILHDGLGLSSWIHPNGDPAREAAARVDWVFAVWQSDRWGRQRRLPVDLNRIDRRDADRGPPAEIDVYTGGQIRWSDVTVPKGLEIAIVDQRLEGHGFTLADGIVMEGKVTDLATGQPLAARVRLERMEPNAEGGYRHPVVAKAAADERGRWVLKKAPAGWHRVVLEADGFVSRIAGYSRTEDQPCWVFLRLRAIAAGPRLGPDRRRLGPAAGRCRGAPSGRRLRRRGPL